MYLLQQKKKKEKNYNAMCLLTENITLEEVGINTSKLRKITILKLSLRLTVCFILI